MKIFITGISGFIGSMLGEALRRNRHTVVGSTSPMARSQKFSSETEVPPEVLALGDVPHAGFFENTDLVIHAAVDTSPQSWSRNVEGSAKIYGAAHEAGVKRQIFISSVSAGADALNAYGREKYRVERLFTAPSDLIVRLGLVVGHGGLFGRMVALVKKFPILPLFDRGHSAVHYIGLEDLLVSFQQLINDSQPPNDSGINLFVPEQVSMSDLLRLMAETLHRRRLLLSIPSKPAISILRGIESLGVRLPVTSQNVQGMVQNSTLSYHSDLPAVVPRYKQIAEILATWPE